MGCRLGRGRTSNSYVKGYLDMENSTIKLIGIFAGAGVTIIATTVTAIGGAIKFIINPSINSRLERIKRDNEIEISKVKGTIDIKIELERLKSKNTEIYFQKQLEAMKELYKLRSKILPNHSMPDMEWSDALSDIALNFEQTEKDIEDYLIEYFSVLDENIIDKLDSAKYSAAEGKFDSSDPTDLKCSQLADTLWKQVEKATSELKKHIELQTHNTT